MVSMKLGGFTLKAVFAMLLCVGFFLEPCMAAGETTPDDLFKAGIAAFQLGDYATATKNFEEVLAQGPQGEALETLLFTLATTYFSQKNNAKAEEYYTRSLKEFPEGKYKVKALVALSQIQSQSGRKAEAEKSLQLAAQGGGEIGMRAKLAQASILVESGKQEEAAKVLKSVIEKGIKDDLTVQAAMALTELEAKRGNLDEALKLLDQLQSAPDLINNPLQLDILSVRIGDGMLSKGERQKALKMYSIVRPKEVVIDLQKERIASLEKKISDARAGLQTNPKAFMEINASIGVIQSNITQLKAVLEQFEKLPDTEVPVRIRQAKAYDELDQKWETILIWESLLKSKDPKIHEDALFSIASAYCALVRKEDAAAALDRYLGEFPNGKYAEQAGYLKGAVLLEAGDYASAEGVFGTFVVKGGQSSIKGDMQFLLANAKFAQAADPEKRDKYKEAVEDYKNYLSNYPGGKFAEECLYRVALCYFQLGDYSKALEALQDYAKKYPKGQFIGDADYRIALCYNAAEKYDEVLKRCDAWMKAHDGELMQAEVLALRGDAYAAKEMPTEAAEAYRYSVDMGQSDELLKYSLFEANKQYQKINRWDQISEMFSRFAKRHPEHPAAIAAVYWVSKAKIKEGKTEEAKRYLADTILQTINDRRKDAVEQLLGQLAQICSKRPRQPFLAKQPATESVPAGGGNPDDIAASASPVPRPSATPLPAYDAEEDFAKYLNDSNVGNSPLSKARLRYGQAQLAGFTRKPERQNELMASIYRDFPAEELSAMLLSECGDIALAKGQNDKAEAFYKELMTSFPKSDLLEYAYCGMGEVELARNKPDDALRWFDDAVEKAGAEAKLSEVTYGKGLALLALGKTDEAKAIFEQVAANKEWRGEITARALLSIGDIEEKKGNIPTAIQYYQRVFVAYQKYPDVVITAYLKAADGFIKLNEPAKAAAHLREMLSKPRLAKSPRIDDARKKLEGLPDASSSPSPVGTAPQQTP